jgi:hypothetical protein
MKRHSIHHEAMVETLDALARAAKAAPPGTGGHVCTAVANLIAGAGAWGSHEQLALMRLAVQSGFSPEYWVNSIRVTYTPKEGV